MYVNASINRICTMFAILCSHKCVYGMLFSGMDAHRYHYTIAVKQRSRRKYGLNIYLVPRVCLC